MIWPPKKSSSEELAKSPVKPLKFNCDDRATDATENIQNLIEEAHWQAFNRFEHALYRYARCEVDGPTEARRVLGTGEFWDADYGKSFVRLRRVWRRVREFFS